ncbi:MAG: nuclear transport factor 2 family protein [Ekhidna sp.]
MAILMNNLWGLTISVFLLISSFLGNAQVTKRYFRHLAYNHVSPHVEIKGVYEINESEAKETSHYVFTYDSRIRVIEIINKHYHSERKHPLASIGAYKTIIAYTENTEERIFHDPNGKRITNDREVFKEVYDLDGQGFRKELNFYDEDDKPMESNWGITRYKWEQVKKMIIEKRFDLNGEPVSVSPYFKFGVTGIVYDKEGLPKAHYNLDENLEISVNEMGVASYQDTYDKEGSHIEYTYHGVDDELVQNQWGFARGVKKYDENGNQIGLSRFDTDGILLGASPTPSNVKIKKAEVASSEDSIQIKETALGYLVALQQLKPKLMKKVMHESLAKRTIGYDRAIRNEYPRETTFDEMMDFATSWNKSGAKFPFNPSNEVIILDVYQRVANVKLISDNWIEYLHLIKLNGEWKIINLLWQHKDASRYSD